MNQTHDMAQGSMPRVLLLGLSPGLGGMHMPRALARVGFEVAFIGSKEYMGSKSGHIKKHYPWPSLSSGFSVDPFLACTRQFQPHRIIPLDELSAQILQQIGTGKTIDGKAQFPSDLVELTRRSIGNPAGYTLFAVRRNTDRIARAAGIRAPAQVNVENIDTCIDFGAKYGYPMVIKAEGSMGGTGTFILDSDSALRDFFSRGYVLADGQKWIVQRFISGQLGMHAVLADQGRVLASVSATQLVRRSARVAAPSSVVRLCRNEAMASSCAAFVAASGASGFHAWDFQLDSHGNAFLIEHNPRPISISHLGGLLGDDLCAALASLCGVTIAPPPASEIDEYVVALFPDEWRRDVHSPNLTLFFHDVPWEDPELMTAVVNANLTFI